MPSAPEKPGVLLVSGFHRSGTSLTAQWLHRGGLPMGSALLPAHPSNPDGHFEDGRAVRFHESWLRRQGSDWLYHDEAFLMPDRRLNEDIEAYIADRDADTCGTWGLKDPRLILALPAWSPLLSLRMNLLLVVRHWAECLQSLAIRHSRELAWHLMPPGPRLVHLRPWLAIDDVARAWLASAQRMLQALEAYQGRSWLLTARGLAESTSLRQSLPECHLLRAHRDDAKPSMKSDLFQRRVSLAMLPPITPSLREVLDATWESLLTAAHVYASDEGVKLDTTPRTPPELRQRMLSHLEESSHRASAKLVAAKEPVQSVLASIRDALALHRPELAARRLAEALETGIIEPESEARHIADAEMARYLGDLPAAAQAWRNAARKASVTTSIGHVVRAAQAWLEKDDGDAALRVFDEESERLGQPLPPETWSAMARGLELARGIEARDAFIRTLPEYLPATLFLRGQQCLSGDYSEAFKTLNQAVRTTLKDSRLDDWLSQCQQVLPDTDAFNALLESIVPHWLSAFDEDELTKRF